ncbi:MAG: hypothetical protein K6E19_11380 [Lachnospiraceae bacterium]|nr:hypothetical protein [Lachnospiraceae bacterium]
MDTAIKTADYFMSEMEKQGYSVPPCDFNAPKEPRYIDASAGAIAANGFIEISKCLGVAGRKYYDFALYLLKGIEKECCNFDHEVQYVVDYASERYGAGVNIPIIYSDFFFMEALTKLYGGGHIFW